MKLILTLLLAIVTNVNYAAIYYFSSSGNDSYTAQQAQNQSTPWKSIAKLNSIFASLQAGDQVLFKRGETFYGTITVNKSGSLSQPIQVSSYGSGELPIITGFITPTSWTSTGGGVYEATVPELGSTVNQLTINGVSKAMGRFPNADAANKGYLTYESFAGNTQISDNELTSSTNWTGAEVVIRKVRGVIDRNKISSHSGNAIAYVPASVYQGSNNFGYFIQNDLRTLDQAGEWYYNPSSKKLYVHLGGASPSGYTIKASALTNLFYLNSQNYVTVSAINFTGSNMEAVRINGANNIIAQNLKIEFAGETGIKTSYTNYLQILDCDINNSQNDGIDLAYNNEYGVIRNNTINNSSILTGMGTSGDGNSTGINIRGKNNLAEYNRVLNSGYNGIAFTDNNNVIKNNYIDTYCLIKDDGGGIYTFVGNTNLSFSGRKVIGNVVVNGIGAGEGTSDPKYLPVNGFFLDDNTGGIEITGNTFANNANFGIFYHNAHDIILNNNTFFNNKSQIYMRSYEAPYGNVTNNDVQGNIFFAKQPTQLTSHLVSIRNDIGSFGRFNNNYYIRPLDDKLSIQNDYLFNGGNNTATESFDLEGWKQRYSQDVQSRQSPAEVPSYTVTNQSAQNKFANGGFNTGINYINCWSPTSNCNTSWNSGGKLDGGAIQIGFTNPANNNNIATTTLSVGSISANKNYLLKFSSIGANNGKSFAVYLRDNDSYNKISLTKYIKVNASRTENEVLFSLPTSAANAGIIFELNDQYNTVWLDNVSLVEADVTYSNADDYIFFKTNPTSSAVSVALPATYVTVDKITVSGSVNIPAYGSVVLVKTSATVTKTNQTISFDDIPSKTQGDPAFTINAVASSQLPVSFRVVSGPANISGNQVTITGTGTVSIEASQAGNANFNAATPVTKSFTVVATATTSCSGTGSILREQWNNLGGYAIASIPLSVTPSSTSSLNSFESQDRGEMYGARIRGYICPPQTGAYTFWVSGDDVLELWLSTDDNPNNKRKIASSNYTMFREWNKYASQKSATISLQQGTRYYVELLQKEGGGGGHSSVGWTLPNSVFQAPVPGSSLVQFTGTVSSGNPQQPNIITFNPIDNQFVGAAIDLAATASSGLPVSFRIVSGPATLSGNRVTVSAAGTVTIEASQAGNSTYSSATAVSRSFTVNAVQSCSNTGTILREQWSNIPGWSLASIPVQTTPSSSSYLTSLESQDVGQLYGARIRGYICPPQTGSYTFFISGDDVLELWLSTDENPSAKVKIATTNYTTFREWNKYPTQRSNAVTLQSGRRYYVEVLQKEGGGGGHFSVGWMLPNSVFQAPVPGANLVPFIASGNTVTTANARIDTSPAAVEENASNSVIKIYPNPVNNQARVTYTAADPGFVKIELLDASGQNLRALFSGSLSQGQTKVVNLSAINLVNGTYFIKVSTLTGIKTKRLIVQK